MSVVITEPKQKRYLTLSIAETAALIRRVNPNYDVAALAEDMKKAA